MAFLIVNELLKDFVGKVFSHLEEVCREMEAKLRRDGDGDIPFILHRNQWKDLVELYSRALSEIKSGLIAMLKSVMASLQCLSSVMKASRKSFEECIAPHARGYFPDGSNRRRGEGNWNMYGRGDAEEEQKRRRMREEEEQKRRRMREDLRLWMAKHALRHILDDEVPHRHADNFRTTCLAVMIHICPERIPSSRTEFLMNKEYQGWKSSEDTDGLEARAFFSQEEMANIDIHISQLLLHRLRDDMTDENLEDAVKRLSMDPAQFRKCDDEATGSGNLGEGSFGKIKLRKWISDDHHVAMKKGTLGRHELGIQARVRHPNLLPLLCCCTRKGIGRVGGDEQQDDGENLLPVMEQMDTSLEKLMPTDYIPHERITGPRYTQEFRARYTEEFAVEMMLQIAKGMDYLHSQNIVHRDLKPANILVSVQGADDVRHRNRLELLRLRLPFLRLPFLRVKVADFGVSKLNFQSSDPSNSYRVGSGFYRAPEVVDEESNAGYTRKSDVYSFAMVCYRIITGTEPFRDDSEPPYVLRQKIRNEALRPKFDANDETWPALKSMVKACWHEDASMRPDFAEITEFLRLIKICELLESICKHGSQYTLSRGVLVRKELFREFRDMGSDLVKMLKSQFYLDMEC